MKINAQTLSAAGWSDEQIDRYYTLLDRKQTRGLTALSPEGRRFLRTARQAVETLEAAHQTALVAGRKNRLTGKNPVEGKKHYRWIETEIAAHIAHTDLGVNEISAMVIIKREVLRALSLYQPVLDMLDTTKRSQFNAPMAELLELATTYPGARVARFDNLAAEEVIRAEFPNDWNDNWTGYYEKLNIVAIPLSNELDFISVVRPEIERLTREIYPSVVATV
jgi:hypothetical protein